MNTDPFEMVMQPGRGWAMRKKRRYRAAGPAAVDTYFAMSEAERATWLGTLDAQDRARVTKAIEKRRRRETRSITPD